MIDVAAFDQSWWPDLTGQTGCILASGPSMSREQCDAILGTDWYVLAINSTWRIAPWVPAIYGCDWQWWAGSAAPGAGDYAGLRVIGYLPKRGGNPYVPDELTEAAGAMRFLPVQVGHNQLLWDGRSIGSGCNGAFQAANWLARCGISRLILLGVDCHSPDARWHGRHVHTGASIPDAAALRGWVRAWNEAAGDFAAHGIEVVNCTPGSAVGCFRRSSLADIVSLSR